MEEAQLIRTTLLTAYQRAYHAMYDDPKIFDDHLAYAFLTGEERASFEHFLVAPLQSYDPVLAASFPDREAALAWVMHSLPGPPIVLGRARYTEDNLKKAVRQGVQQYVILGAGMDTFAFRYPEMAGHLQVFEVDHPATQAFKRNRLAELGWGYPAQLHFVPIDFTKESLKGALTRTPYDPQTSSFFSLLGVTYYLPRDTVFATFRAIADIAPTGSSIIFDYLDTDAFIPEKAAPRALGMLEVGRLLGTPFETGLDPSTLAADLASLGFLLYEDLGPSDIQEQYFHGRTDGYYACEHAHFAWAVVK